MQRIFAEIDSGKPGPLVVVVAALHGNEHVGFHALHAVAERLRPDDFVGKIIGVTGNLQAANQKQRYIEKDLNRFFLADYLNADHKDVPEWHEARGLIDAINKYALDWPDDQEIHLLDMHSMSGEGTPFTCFPHTKRNEHIAHLLPLPAIADIVEFLPGTLVDYFADKFTSTMVVEGGQHDAEVTRHVGRASLFCFLYHTGCLFNEALLEESEHFLKQHIGDTHSVFTRIKYRYHIEHSGHFDMQPGYHNLQLVKASQLLAKDQGNEVLAPFAGRVVLPCYQKQGDDGFFISVDED